MPLRRSRSAYALLALLGAVACTDQPFSEESSDPQLPVATVRVAGPEQVMPGELIVKLRPGMAPQGVAALNGLRLIERPAGGRFSVYLVKIGSERAQAAKLRQDPNVEYAEPNYLRQLHAIDPRLWAFRNPGGLNMSFVDKRGRVTGPLPASYASILDADEDNVEGYAAGGAPVVVGSIDTGADMDHPEYVGRTIAGKDWYNNDNNPEDDDGHGSHTTGTMVGSNVGIAGVSGAAANVRVYVQKVCGRKGCPTSAIVSAIYAAADYPGMVAMNMSLGGGTESQAEKDAIAYATSKNVLVIASAGNDGTGTVACPACDVNSISVAATTWRDERASYSQFGPGLDISAPGGNCFSNTTSEGCIYSAFKTGAYEWEQGTSMAAPQVTGTAGVVASVTGLRGAALRARILSTADDLGAPGNDNNFGAGRLNTYRAVTNSSLPAGQ